MKIQKINIEGPLLIIPTVFTDARGYFFEYYRKDKLLQAAGIDIDFVQDNMSLSQINAVRGLHFQKKPHAQAKFVTVIKGKVLDVIVDIRKNSTTYGQSFSVELSEYNHHVLFVPVGFAHGFSVQENNTIFAYKCSNYYDKNCEGGLLYNDPDLNIDWKVELPIVSEKDLMLSKFKDFVSPF